MQLTQIFNAFYVCLFIICAVLGVGWFVQGSGSMFGGQGVTFGAGIETDSAISQLQLSPSQNEDLAVLMTVLPNRSIKEIKRAILKYKDDPDRRSKASDVLIEDHSLNSTFQPSHEGEGVLCEEGDDVTALKLLLPRRTEAEIIKSLEIFKHHEQRRAKVFQELKYNDTVVAGGIMPNRNLLKLDKEQSTILSNQEQQIVRILDIFPNTTREVIESTLKEFAECEDPVNVTLNTLMSQEEPQSISVTQSMSSNGDLSSMVQDNKSMRIKDVMYIMTLFVDVDPLWVFLHLHREEGETMDNVVRMMLNQPNCFDRLITRQRMQLIQTQRFMYLDPHNLNPSTFIKIFPNPQAYFRDKTRAKQVSILYVDHVRVSLLNDFPNVSSEYLCAVCFRHRGLLYPSYTEIAESLSLTEEQSPVDLYKLVDPPVARKKCTSRIGLIPKEHIINPPRTLIQPWPQTIDHNFFMEFQFTRWGHIFDNLLPDRKMEVLRNEKNVCELCRKMESSPKDMSACKEDHLFCKECITKQIQIEIEAEDLKLKCLNTECNQVYLVTHLSGILNANTFNKLMRFVKNNHVDCDFVHNLVSCPFCGFYRIYEDDNRCMNRACLKVACKNCSGEYHAPFKCDELEIGTGIDWSYVQRKAAQAINRTCPLCQAQLLKKDDMNLLHCACGVFICFFCQTQFTTQDEAMTHFLDTGYERPLAIRLKHSQMRDNACPLLSTIEEISEEERRVAANEIRMQYLETYPDLKYIKRQWIEKMKSGTWYNQQNVNNLLQR